MDSNADDCSDDTAAPTVDRPQLGKSLETAAYLARNWKFESIPLQRRESLRTIRPCQRSSGLRTLRATLRGFFRTVTWEPPGYDTRRVPRDLGEA